MIKFKPFKGIGEKDLRGSLSQLDLSEKMIKITDNYSYTQSPCEDSDVLIDTAMQVDCVTTIPKNKVTELSYYWCNKNKGYFVHINGNTWGFKDKKDGLEVYNQIYNWLYDH